MPAPSSTSRSSLDIAVIGGGPAGYFAAITAKETNPGCRVTILEKSARVLGKVKISGGGRCNITHDSPDPRELAEHYPRGRRELIGPFTRFGAPDAAAWFTAHGVPLRTFPDGCVFPASDMSRTVIDCLTGEAKRLGVALCLSREVIGIRRDGGGFLLSTEGGETLAADRVLIATGGRARKPGEVGPYRPTGGYALAASLGHTIATPVPSLFTFTVKDPLLDDLAGIVVDPVAVRAPGVKGLPPQEGPLLITHWGLSGPAILKLSAWGARAFGEAGYRFTIAVDWLPQLADRELEGSLTDLLAANKSKQLKAFGPWSLSRRLWVRLLGRAGLDPARRWGDVGPRQLEALVRTLKATELTVSGQSAFKDEFVACGGVLLKEVDLRTMQSRLAPGLHFAGEVLDIDGVTGGFNFQACWTTGRLAGLAMASG